MSFTGNEGGPIKRETAKAWINNYQESESAREPEKTVTKAHFFGKEKILKLLNEDECVGLRIYYGLDDNGDQKLFMVAVEANMNDILPIDMESTSEDGPMILDLTHPCPPYCGNDNI